MSGTEETASDSEFVRKLEKLPDVFEIPKNVVEAYSRVDKTAPLKEPLPIGFIDGILQVVDLQSEFVMNSTKFTIDILNKDKEAAAETLLEIARKVIRSQSQTRRLVHLLMVEAVSQQLGEDAINDE